MYILCFSYYQPPEVPSIWEILILKEWFIQNLLFIIIYFLMQFQCKRTRAVRRQKRKYYKSCP